MDVLRAVGDREWMVSKASFQSCTSQGYYSLEIKKKDLNQNNTGSNPGSDTVSFSTL